MNYDTPYQDSLLARHSSNKFDFALAALRNYDAAHQDSLLARHSSSKLDSALAALRNCQLNQEFLNMLIHIVGDGGRYLLLVLDEVVFQVIKLRVLLIHGHELLIGALAR